MAVSKGRPGKAPGIHAVLGADSFLSEQALESLLDSWVGPLRDDTVEAFRGEETTWARVLDAARTGSLFAERRAVVVRGAEQLSGEPEGLDAYLEDPTPGVALVLVAPKVDRRRGVWQRVLGRAEVHSAEPLKGRALRARVLDEIRRRGLRIADEGVQELLERVGQDLRRLMGEIDKLEAFAAGGEPLTAQVVSAVMGHGIARPLYRLADALMARRAVEALELIGETLEEGESAVVVLGAIHRALRQLRGALALGPGRRAEAVSRLGLLPFKVDAVLDASRLWKEKDLEKAMAALGKADRALKTGADPQVTLAAAVLDVLGGAARAAPAAGR